MSNQTGNFDFSHMTEYKLRLLTLSNEMFPLVKPLLSDEAFAEFYAMGMAAGEAYEELLGELPPPSQDIIGEVTTPPPPSTPKTVQYKVVSQFGVNVRDDATIRSKVVGSEPSGSVVTFAYPVQTADASGYRWAKRADGHWMAIKTLTGTELMRQL